VCDHGPDECLGNQIEVSYGINLAVFVYHSLSFLDLCLAYSEEARSIHAFLGVH
jgi:hypothetical protein